MAIKFLNSVNADSGVLYVDAANDRVGIGTTSPDSGLDVRTTSRFWHGSTSNYTSFAYGNEINTFNSSGGNAVMYLQYRSGHLNVGAGTLFVQSGNSNVGIGTTSPSTKLEVSGETQVITIRTSYPSNSSQRGAFLWKDSANIVGAIDTRYDGTTVDMHFGSLYNSGYNSTSRLVIKGDGNVGINNTSPSHMLDITTNKTGNGAGSTIRINRPNNASYENAINWATGGTNKWFLGSDNDSTENFHLYNWAANDFALTVKSSNNYVGIGTTSPAEKLNIYTATGRNFKVNQSTANVTILENDYELELRSGGGYDLKINANGSSTYGNVTFRTNGSERMRVTSGGNVGIGTTSPDSKLHLQSASATGAIINLETTHSGGIPIYNLKGAHSAQLRYQDENGNNQSRIDFLDGGDFNFIDATDGTSHLKINSNGNVGIGTTSPASKLHVNGKVTIGNIGTTAPQEPLMVKTETAAYFPGIKIENYNSEVGLYIQNIDGYNAGIGTGRYYNSGFWRSDLTSPTSVRFDQGVIRFYAQSGVTADTDYTATERMRITADGKVGIGDSSPSYKLDVTGDARFTSHVYSNASMRAPIFYDIDDTNYYVNPTGATSAILAGSVGIGTTSPATTVSLQFTDSSTTQSQFHGLLISNTNTTVNNGSAITFGHSGAAKNSHAKIGAIYADRTSASEDTHLFFGTLGGGSYSERMRITSTGHIGMGTTAPYAYLHVKPSNSGNAFSNVEGLLVETGGSSNSYYALQVATAGGGKSFNVTNAGNVGIGTASPAAKLVVAGTAYINQTSDYFGVSNTKVQISAGSSSDNVGIRSNKLYLYSYANGADSELIFGDGNAHWGLFASDNRFALYNHATSATSIHVSNAGNVGIGTTSPSEKLHVSGNIKSNHVYAETYRSSRTDGDIYIQAASSSDFVSIGTEGGNNNLLTVLGSGNVGIGTASPSEKLHVSGDVRIEGDLTVNGSYTQIDTDVNTTEQWNVTNDGTGPAVTINQKGAQDIMDVQDDGTSVFYIEDGGNVGIGTTDPATNVDVKSDANPTIRITSGKDGTWTADEEIGSIEFYSSDGSGVGAGVRSAIRSLAYDNFGSRSELTFSTTGTAGDTENMRITSYGKLKLNQYGSNTFTGTAAYALAVDSSGNVIETAVQGSPTGGSGTAGKITKWDTSSTLTDSVITESGDNLGIGVAPKTGGSTWQHIQFGGTGNIIARKSDSTVDAMFANNYYINSSNVDSHIITGAATRMFLNDGEIRFDTAPSAAADAAATFTNRMFIANGGNVGIGTTSPTEKLHVNGNVKVAGSVGVTNIVTNRVVKFNGSVLDDSLLYDNGTTVAIGTTSPNSWAQLETTGTVAVGGILYIKSSQKIQGLTGFPGSAGNLSINPDGGNVGIGTTSPVRPLHIHRSATSTDVRISLTDGTTGAGTDSGFDIIKGTNQNAYLWNYSNATMRFGTNALERMRITNTGNVGIGTTSPNPHNWGQRSLTVQAEGTNAYSALEAYGTGTGAGAVLFGAGSIMHSSVQSTNGSHLVFTTNASNSGISQTERMRILSNGNVGIGTTSPSQKLAVIGNVIAGAGAADNYFEAVHSDGSSTRLHGYGLFMGRTSSYIRPTTDNTHALYIGTDANQWSTVNIDSSTTLFKTNGVEHMRITSGGNVGIGTTTPDAPLTVHNSTDPEIRFGYSSTQDHRIVWDSSKVYIHADPENANASSAIGLGVDGTIGLFMDNEHDVGIGTNSPNTRLHVADNTTGVIMRIQNSSAGEESSLRFQALSSTSTQEYADIALDPQAGSGALVFRNPYTSERMRIDSSGNVGIGTTSPSTSLHVVKDASWEVARFEADSYPTATVYSQAAAKYAQLNIYDTRINSEPTMELRADTPHFNIRLDDTGNVLTILDGGNVGIGTTSPGQKLQVNGTIYATSNFQTSGNSMLRKYSSAWTYPTHDVVYNGWTSSTGDYTYLKSAGNSDTNHGIAVVADNGFFVGRTNLETGAITDSATDPIDVVWLRINSSGNLQLPSYGAGYLKSDASGNITVDTDTIEDTLDSVTDRGNTTTNSVAFGTTTKQTNTDLTVDGTIKAGGKTTYTKGYGSLNTTGNAVAGLVSSFNGASAMFIFTCYGHTGSYQRIVYSCWNTSGTSWNVKKVIDEGDNQFDITVDAVGATRTFTFVSRSGTASYSPNVNIEHVGAAIDTSYL